MNPWWVPALSAPSFNFNNDTGKAKYSEEDDSRADFSNVLPSLDERQRAWLHEALVTLYGAHDWLEPLAKRAT